jgi:UDP-glucose 4-epimerase
MARLLEGDVADAGMVRRVLAESRPEVVFHLAAHHFIPFCVAHPAETLRVNVLGTQILLDSLSPDMARCLVFTSSADVYASGEGVHAEDDALDSSNVYGLSKLVGERLMAFAARRLPGARFLTARLFNVYGPGETNPHVLPDILAGLGGSKTVRLGSLEPRRDYVWVGDVVDVLLRLASYQGQYSTFNVGTGVGSSVRHLLDGLEQVLDRAIEVEHDPAKVRPVDRPSLVADTRRTRAELGWVAHTPLVDGLRALVRAHGLDGRVQAG